MHATVSIPPSAGGGHLWPHSSDRRRLQAKRGHGELHTGESAGLLRRIGHSRVHCSFLPGQNGIVDRTGVYFVRNLSCDRLLSAALVRN